MEVNYFGVLNMTRAFAPLDARARYARDLARHDQAAQGHGHGYRSVAVTACRAAMINFV
jgi:hypothetical protein